MESGLGSDTAIINSYIYIIDIKMKKHSLCLFFFCFITCFMEGQTGNTIEATGFYKTAQHKVELGQYDSAVYYFSRAIDLHYPDKKAYGNRGINQFRQGNYEEALVDYDTALKYIRDNSLLFCNKGILLARLKRNTEAITYFNLALAIDSNDAETYSCRVLLTRRCTTAWQQFQIIIALLL